MPVETKQKSKMDAQAMMEEYDKQSIPGEHHTILELMAGSWVTKGKFWMDPDSPPNEVSNACEQKMVLGGRYLQQMYTGHMMGTTFAGIGYIGYDNLARKYVSSWIDTMSTGIYFSEGKASPDGRSITLNGRFDDPVKGPMKFRSLTRIVDDNTLKMEMFGTVRDGKEEKMSEEIFSRKR